MYFMTVWVFFQAFLNWKLPIARERSTKTLLTTNPRIKLRQMLTALVAALTLGWSISVTTTQTRVPYPPLPRNSSVTAMICHHFFP